MWKFDLRNAYLTDVREVGKFARMERLRVVLIDQRGEKKKAERKRKAVRGLFPSRDISPDCFLQGRSRML